MLSYLMKRALHQSAPSASKGQVYKGPTTKKVYDGQQFKSEGREKSDSAVLKETAKRHNLKLYNRYISEASKRKSLQLAKSLFSQLLEQSLQPNEFTYTCMINACSRTFHAAEAESYLRQMQKENLKPNEITWTAVIKGATSVFDIPKSISFLQEMLDSGVAPNARTFNTILRACFRTGDFSTAIQVHDKMKKLGVKPDTSTLQSLTQLQAQAMLIADANDSVNHLETLVQQKEAQTTGSQYFIDPSLYLLLASVSILTGTPLKRSKHFMDKFDETLAKLAQKPKNEDDDAETEESGAVAPEMVMESTHIRRFLEKGEGLGKANSALAKLGPRGSPFVKTFNPSDTDVAPGLLWVPDPKETPVKRKLEICSGSGDWILSKAQEDDASWAALEIRFDRVHELWRKILLTGMQNRITVIHADAAHASKFIPEASVDEIFINFPDPPHTRWSPQRMVTVKLLKSLATLLVPGGKLIVSTDDFDYIRWIHDDSKSLFKYYDTLQTTVSKHVEGYGTSYFDGLWSNRGRKDRAWLTLVSLTAEQKTQVQAEDLEEVDSGMPL